MKSKKGLINGCSGYIHFTSCEPNNKKIKSFMIVKKYNKKISYCSDKSTQNEVKLS